MRDVIRALAPSNEDGRSVHPARKSEVVYSMQRLPVVVGLPAAQTALPAYPSAPPAAAAQPILISTHPGLENVAKD